MKYRPEYDPKVIGKNLKRLREAKNLSVNEVREYLRLSKQAVYNYESGKRYPQSDTMFALMELYEADLHDIIDEYVEVSAIMDIPCNALEKSEQTICEETSCDVSENTEPAAVQEMNEHAGIYFLEMDGIFDYQGIKNVVTNVISLEARRKKYAELLGKYYKAG